MRLSLGIFLLFVFCFSNVNTTVGDHHDDVLPHPDFRQIIEEFPILEIAKSEEKEEADKWVQAGNLAYFLNLHSIKSVSIPVMVNLIFIGFEGDGNNGITFSEENFKPWFAHIPYNIRHSVVPVGEDQTTTLRVPTPKTSVDYTIMLNVVKLCPMVNTILSDFLLWNVRSESQSFAEDHEDDETREYHYVDSFKFSSVIQNLLEYLNINNQYTIILFNPTKPVPNEDIYGYRTGFANEEISILYKRRELTPTNITSTNKKESIETVKPSELGTETNNTQEMIQFRDFVEESEEWAQWYIKNQGKIENQKHCDKSSDEENSNCIFSKPSEKPDIRTLAKEMMQGTRKEQEYINKVLTDKDVYEDCLVDAWIGHSRFAFIDFAAGPFSWGPNIAAEGIRTEDTVPKVPTKSILQAEVTNIDFTKPQEVPNSEDRYNLYKAESSLLQAYWEQYCTNVDAQAGPFCTDLKKVLSMRKGDSSSSPIIGGIEGEGANASIIMDEFLSQLGSTISMSLNHLVIPPSPLFSTPYYEHVTFHIFILKNHQEYNPRGIGFFNYDSFKQEVNRLRLPTQEFTFTVKEITVGDDPALSMALATSLKSSVVPKLTADGVFSTEEIVYIDSKDLHHHLKAISNSDISEDDNYESVHSSKHIPIFIFSLNYDVPVFVDKYYSSKALSDMIITVQSNIPDYESRFSCNKKQIMWDLRDPIKFCLGSVSLILGGIVPSHISYSQARESAFQNWLWSVGDNPLAYTSSKYRFSLFHRDIAFRNYIVYALNDSIRIVNTAVQELVEEKTHHHNLEAKDILPLQTLRDLHKDIKDLWLQISMSTYRLDYSSSVSLLKPLFEKSRKFKQLATEVSENLDVFDCIEDNSVDSNPIFQWLIPLSIATNIGAILLFFTLRSKKSKVKIN